jgi:hypothetical protein
MKHKQQNKLVLSKICSKGCRRAAFFMTSPSLSAAVGEEPIILRMIIGNVQLNKLVNLECEIFLKAASKVPHFGDLVGQDI